jgi:hypothetical protein
MFTCPTVPLLASSNVKPYLFRFCNKYLKTVLFQTKETKIVDVIIVKYGPKGWEWVRGDWKVRVGQLILYQARDQSG